MPHIEGISLREKLAQEGELPIGEAVRFLRDVVDALSEAHDKGVVHRDIKPDNVLLTKHHALVTDFGVAKAVSEATGRQKLTTEGIALGTPAYMAPEQAAADPHIDHRADIYAVGAVAYELLTGRPPFTGTTPQEILAAHVTQAVEPVTKYRDTVSPALAELVMRCLKKKPADRWQSAQELLPQLEALATPSGGMTPTGAMPVTSVRGGWKAWAAIGAVVAVVAAVLGVLVSGGEPEGPPRLVVLPFENLGAAEDEYFADGMTQAITSRLGQIPDIGIIARASAIQYKGTEKTVQQIGDELGVGYILNGTVQWNRYGGEAGEILVTPQLIDVSDGTQLWSEPYQVAMADVFSIQADIAEQVAAGLHVVLQPEETEAIEAPPTENLAAYDVYLRGLDYYERGISVSWEQRLLALEMFDSAAALDPGFTLAHVMRGNAHLSLGSYDLTLQPEMLGAPRWALAKEALDEAVRLDPEHVEVQKLLARYSWYSGERVQTEEHYTAVLRQEPNDVDALLALAYFQSQRGEGDSAEALIERAGELDPRSYRTAYTISDTYARHGKYQDALRYADRGISLAADESPPYFRKAWLHILAGDTAAAHVALQLGAERVGLVSLLAAMARHSAAVRVFRIFNEYGEVMRRLSQDAFGIDTLDYLLAKANSYYAAPEMARPYFDSLVVLRTAYLELNPDMAYARAGRANAYAGLGRKQAAMRDADSVLLMGTSLYPMWFIAEAYVMIGEHDAAIEQLRNLMPRRGRINPSVLRLDPIWDPLREHPGFQELLEGGN
jgi:serine/threonine-protein kinase